MTYLFTSYCHILQQRSVFSPCLPGSIRYQGQAGRRARRMRRPLRPGRQAAGKKNQALSKCENSGFRPRKSRVRSGRQAPRGRFPLQRSPSRQPFWPFIPDTGYFQAGSKKTERRQGQARHETLRVTSPRERHVRRRVKALTHTKTESTIRVLK